MNNRNTKTNTNKNNQKTWKMSTAAFLLTAIAFISSSALASVDSISVFAAAPSNSSSSVTSINQAKTLDHMLVQNLKDECTSNIVSDARIC
jgi:hypothetical protein